MKKHPELLLYWHDRNGNFTPFNVRPTSLKEVWWQCPNNPEHVYEGRVGNRVWAYKAKRTGCPYCSGKLVDSTLSLQVKNPEVALYWHPTKNGKLTPLQVLPQSNKKVWWLCPKGHEKHVPVQQMVNYGQCGVCKLEERSFGVVFPDLVSCWHPTKNGSESPFDIFASSGKRVWWVCPKFSDHEYQLTPNARARATSCPFCDGRKIATSNCLSTSHPDLAREWHPTFNENLTPSQVTAGRATKVWWLCPNSHPYYASLLNRKKGTGCPICSESKGESAISRALESQGVAYERERSIDGCKNIRPLPFDFLLGSQKSGLATIEFQGRQHYEPYKSDDTGLQVLKQIQFRDEIKRGFCEKNKIQLLVIPYWRLAQVSVLVNEFVRGLKIF